MTGFGKESAEIVRAARSGEYKVGMILGSGLGSLATEVEGAVRVPYCRLTGFPVSSVTAHASELVVGTLEGVPVVILSGRAHYYESGNPSIMRTPLETLKELGCEIIIATNAAGSLRESTQPGSPMLINDHINWSGMNPLIGEEDESRFLDLSSAYDADLRAQLNKAATEVGEDLDEGVYMWFSGPSFETPAEIRLAQTLGADAVGMSTVPEVILARFLGMRVAAISTITNMGAGLQAHGLSHDETKEMAPLGAAKIKKILRAFLKNMA
ncbi:purine-nucleoside phosphorylase [Pseudovibrio sp. Tun.PSC04-5.I4]|uniref:purine-nucleoside phosphorylase n=1 Tax=Pseudovibrio sp. Tun.PSC04-5.I4 TaxID=1798213 RepID=UPI00088136BB|nr:purine-nucleoside phosphorylase [Pseudovibrio sp. Tun.PSC04-5.I4]SDR18272.1 purine-nucleoside phosphorylase [Pseudovibrio sp. Tun.PSC04-5.I4]